MQIILTVCILEGARHVFRRKFQSDRFYVLLYSRTRDTERLIPAFAQADINYLDYTASLTHTCQNFTSQATDDPMPHAFRAVATRLAHDLGVIDSQANHQLSYHDCDSFWMPARSRLHAKHTL